MDIKEEILAQMDSALRPEFDKAIDNTIEGAFKEDVKTLGFMVANSIKCQWEVMKPHLFYAYCLGVKAQEAKAQAVPQWISTSERMPDEGEEVLVHSLGQVRQVTRDSKWAGGFKERNCYGWQAAYDQSHWMPKSIELPEQYHFYYENDAKQKALTEAQEPANG